MKKILIGLLIGLLSFNSYAEMKEIARGLGRIATGDRYFSVIIPNADPTQDIPIVYASSQGPINYIVSQVWYQGTTELIFYAKDTVSAPFSFSYVVLRTTP
jgi:hypothetical protein